jgi:hypothetical protein
MAALPSVTSVGISQQLAVGDGDGIAHYRVFGRAYLGQEDEANNRLVSRNYDSHETNPNRTNPRQSAFYLDNPSRIDLHLSGTSDRA